MHKFKTTLSMGADKHTHVRLDRISAVKPNHNHSAVLVDGCWVDVEESEDVVLEAIEKWYAPTAEEEKESIQAEENLRKAITPAVDPHLSNVTTKVPAKKAKDKRKIFGKK